MKEKMKQGFKFGTFVFANQQTMDQMKAAVFFAIIPTKYFGIAHAHLLKKMGSNP